MLKRLIDIVVALCLLLVLSPLILLIAVLVLIRLGRPVLFIQSRPGLHGKVFNLYKFRSMRSLEEAPSNRQSDKDRLTAYGHWLRRSSLDELPTFVNVIKGDMSLVGPRPLLVDYLDRYSPEQNRRHLVKPGVTGLAQIRGRNGISWEEKFYFDTWYVDNRTTRMDMSILLSTIGCVFKGQGVSAEGHATMPDFQGSKVAPVVQRDHTNTSPDSSVHH